MKNYKTKVNSKDESKEAQGLFEVMGYKKGMCSLGNYPAVIVTTQDWATGNYCSTRALGLDIPAHENYKEITLAELHDMVVLKRNDVNDATHINTVTDSKVLQQGNKNYYWYSGEWNLYPCGVDIRPIGKTMKEYLDQNRNYEFVLSSEKEEGFIEIPKGMNFAYKDEFNIHFTKLEMGYRDSILVWQRDSEQDEPFLTPECTLNDQYAEIEQLRQEEIHGTVESKPDFNFEADHPKHSHYFISVSDVDEVDFYEIALRYNVTDPCIQHILKKCLAVGNRGHKDFIHDLQDICDTAARALAIHNH